MGFQDLLDAGQLAPAIDQLGQELRANPTDSRRRIVLFELLAFAGQWDRAGKQLDALERLADEGPARLGIVAYRGLIDAERHREKVFRGVERPRFALAPPPAAEAALEAINTLATDRPDDALAAVERSAAARSPLSGTCAGAPFDDLRDADDVLGPVLEVVTATGYFWIPWEQIQYLEVAPPRDLRDLLWARAKLAMFDGQLGEVYLPALYPGSAAAGDDALKLGRGTDWVEPVPGVVRGVGRKLFLVGEDARTVFELQTLEFPPAPGQAATGADATTVETP